MHVFYVVNCIVAYRSGIGSNPAKGTYVVVEYAAFQINYQCILNQLINPLITRNN